MGANDNHSDNPVDSPRPADNAATPRKENPRFRLMIIGTLVTALIFIIIVLVIQITEFQFYRAPQSIWPGAGGTTVSPSPASAVPPGPASVSPIAVPTTTPPPEPAATRAVSQPAASNGTTAAVPTTSTNYSAETTALPIVSTSEVSSTAAPPTTTPPPEPAETRAVLQPTASNAPAAAVPAMLTNNPAETPAASVPAPVPATTPASTAATGTESDAKATPAEPSGTAP